MRKAKVQFSDRAFTYKRREPPVIQEGKVFFTWERFRRHHGLELLDGKLTLPEEMVGLQVAEEFAKASGLSMLENGQIKDGGRLLRMRVEQTGESTRVLEWRSWEGAPERVIAVFKPALPIQHRSGLEALKLELMEKGEWPKTPRFFRRWEDRA